MSNEWTSPDGRVRLICADCLEVLPELEAVDLVLTDPPYGIPKGSAFWRKHGTSIEEWGSVGHNEEVSGWLPLCNVADNAYVLEFMRSHPEAQEATSARHRQCGLTPWHVVSIVKTNPPPTPRPKFVTGYEAALVSFCGKRQWYGSGYVPDRWIGQTPNARRCAVHPTQKPLEAIEQWLTALSDVGSLTLDPFAGSCTTAIACIRTERRCIAIERERKYWEIGIARCKAEYARTALFDEVPA